MASPIGHALVGIGLTALALPLVDVSPSPMLWLGAVVASGLPDLDFIGTAFGMQTRRAHRGPTHSLLVLGIVALAALVVSSYVQDLVWLKRVWVWSVVLLSHPIVDLLATGPQTARRGYGLPLFWPLTSRRWYVRRPLLRPLSLSQYRTRAAWRLLLPELYTFGLACIALILLGRAL